MIKAILKILVLCIAMYYLFVFESSYLPFFTFFSFLASFILVVNILEEPQGKLGLIVAFFFGLLIDIYSTHYIGLAALSFLLCSWLLKYILFKYVRIPSLSWMPKI
ncbi:rod shape-determining protein MreD [bacterium]|jgi:rod shape-determining protein MreD|nr:rod shape-determining protein MreD [bacterium]